MATSNANENKLQMPDFVKINDSPASKEKKRCFFGHHEPNVIRKVTREKKTMSILDLVFFKNRIRKSSKCVYLFTSHTSKQLTSHWNLSLCVYESECECECECVGLSVYGHWTTRVFLNFLFAVIGVAVHADAVCCCRHCYAVLPNSTERQIKYRSVY